jgi:hypothetical protein
MISLSQSPNTVWQDSFSDHGCSEILIIGKKKTMNVVPLNKNSSETIMHIHPLHFKDVCEFPKYDD